MTVAPHNRVPWFASTRGAAWLALALFCFQLSRFYLVVPLDNHTCHSPGEPASSPAHDHHHGVGSHHHEHEDAVPASDDHGSYFQHCKDGLGGLASLTLLGVPLGQWSAVQPVVWVGFRGTSQSLFDTDLPPPFQPPKSLR